MKTTRAYPRIDVDTASVPAVGQAGGVPLGETVAVTGLDRELSAALSPWRKPLAVHDPAKVITDLALGLALGGDTLSDVALLRTEPQLYASVASDPTVSRTIDALATDATSALRALAPPNYRIPFAWQPPALVSQEVSQTLTEQAGAAALHEILLAIMAVLESLLRRPAALLKSGGVGARELKRLAKALALPLQQVRLTIELAADLDLVTVAADGLVPSESFQQWRRLPLAQRAQPLLAAWLSCPRPPSLERDAEGAFVPALRTTEDGYLPTATAICTVLSELPTDRGVIGPEPVLEQLAWAHPLAHREPGWWEQAWQEAEWFGAVAQGRLTALGRAVVSEDSSQLPAVLEGLLPERSTEVLFGTDLTIVAPGSLPAEVIDLLDTVAHREGRGLAGTWRVSRSSVREALDDGETGVGLLETLGAVSGKPLPQPLKYLITDTANNYGRLQVREAAAVVVCPDEALLGQVAADTTLLGLRLVPVAPTVLLAGTDAPRVLAALRSAGYLPAEVDRDGRRVVELLGQQTATQRAAIRERPAAPSTATPPHTEPGDGEPGDGAGDDELAGFFAGSGFDPAVATLMAEEQREEPTQLAARLQAGEPHPGAEDNRELEAQVARYTRRLSQSEIRVLAHALARRDAVFLHYRSTTGGHTRRVVSGLVLQGGYLLGFCHLREQERTFRIDQIEMVTPLQ